MPSHVAMRVWPVLVLCLVKATRVADPENGVVVTTHCVGATPVTELPISFTIPIGFKFICAVAGKTENPNTPITTPSTIAQSNLMFVHTDFFTSIPLV